MEKFDHKRSLGQNFLVNDMVVSQIVDAARHVAADTVVEIGPGNGALTDALARAFTHVIAIELDDRLIPVLRHRFASYDNVEIIHDNVLKMDLSQCAKNYGFDDYVVIANIPYYITAPIIRFFLENTNKPQEMFLMVQKEVAERLTAVPGNMSVLSIAAQYYAQVEYLFTVPRVDFDPQPAVDSAVVRFILKKEAHDDPESFFRIVRIGFSARRKTLLNNLVNGLHCSKKEMQTILEKVNLSEHTRAQELALDEWKVLGAELRLEGLI